MRTAHGKRALYRLVGWSLATAVLLVVTGRDWMEAGRFIVPLVPVGAAFIAAEARRLSGDTLYPVVALLIVLISAPTNLNIVLHQSTGMPITARDEYRKKLKSHGVDTERFSWFEVYNRVHSRYFVALDKIEHVLRSSGEDGISIMSGKMGFTMYHLYSGGYDIESIDNYGLTDNKVRRCLGKAGSKKMSKKTEMEIREILSRIETVRKNCSLEKPDIVYKLGTEKISLFKERGYDTVYLQKGDMSLSDTFVEGGDVPSEQTLLVREEISEDIEIEGGSNIYLRSPQVGLKKYVNGSHSERPRPSRWPRTKDGGSRRIFLKAAETPGFYRLCHPAGRFLDSPESGRGARNDRFLQMCFPSST